MAINPATDKLVRVIDSDSGKTLWRHLVPAGTKATPSGFENGARQ